jgi:hypothetical protein
VVNSITVTGTNTALSTTQFLYHVGRTTSLPTGGTSLTAQQVASSYPVTNTVVLSAPTATASSGDLWTAQGEPLITAVGQFLPVVATYQANIVLAPGESLLVRADANGASWKHSVVFSWSAQ